MKNEKESKLTFKQFFVLYGIRFLVAFAFTCVLFLPPKGMTLWGIRKR